MGKKGDKPDKQSKSDLQQMVQDAINNAKAGGVSKTQMKRDLNHVFKDLNFQVQSSKPSPLKWASLITILITVVGVVLPFYIGISVEDLRNLVQSQECLIPSNLLVAEVGRPISDCRMCRGLEAVPVSTNMTKETFLQKYAYSGIPVLVKQATKDWRALQEFDVYFFRQLYAKYPKSAEAVEDRCNFLRYDTDFMTFSDFLKMDNERVERLDWYVGWSNCDQRVMKELRQYYQRPFFLPDDSTSSSLDWMFIGGAGPGAGMHIDMVDAASWQAQIRGEKTWTLMPPYECEAECRGLNVTVKKGDIIVLDTNLWFHQTEIAKGEMSITIGSEYD